MTLYDLHVHTTFSDGRHSPEEMVQAAIKKGMKRIGFSDHSYTGFDKSYCMQKSRLDAYRKTIHELRDRYAGIIDVLCGIEQDYYSDIRAEGYDYVIGSVHYIKAGDTYIPVDETPKILQNAVEAYFDGDIYRLAECYFQHVSQVLERTNADIIGHFDLITKFNEDGCLFDERDPRYRCAAVKALDTLLKTGKPFEINTGAISRGYRTQPYPAAEWQTYIEKNGGKLICSSDSHAQDTLCFGFDRYLSMS